MPTRRRNNFPVSNDHWTETGVVSRDQLEPSKQTDLPLHPAVIALARLIGRDAARQYALAVAGVPVNDNQRGEGG